MKSTHNTPYIKLIFGFFCLLFFVCHQTWAINLSSDADKLIREFSSKERKVGTGAAIILKEGIMSVEEGGLYNTTIHILGKILDEKAKSDYGQIPIYFNSYYEEINLDFAHTILKGGEVIRVPDDAIQIKTLSDSKYLKRYTDIKALAFSFPALEVGSIFEYQVKFKQKIPKIKNRWYGNFSFNYKLNNTLCSPYIFRIDPVYKSRFIIKISKEEKFDYQVKNIEILPSIRNDNDYLIYIWEMNELPPIEIEENMPVIDEIIPNIEYSSLKGWNEADEFFSRPFLMISEVDQEINSKAKEIIRDAKTDEEKIKVLFNFMQRKIEYIDADLNRGGFIPHPADETLKNQYGDCKDQVYLFISMLKSIGILAFPALIDPYCKVEQKIPSPSTFSHMIVYVPMEGDDLWLDTTSRFTEFPYLHWSDQDRWALIVNGKGGEFIKTPSSKPEDNQLNIKFCFSFKEVTLTGEMTIEGKGVMSGKMKSYFIPIQIKQQDDFIRDVAKHIHSDANVRAFQFSDLEDPQVPFKINASFELKGLWEQAESNFTYKSTPLIVSLISSQLNDLTSPEDRNYDYLLNFIYSLSEERTYSPPSSDLKPGMLPLDGFLDTPFFLFYRRFIKEENAIKEIIGLRFKEDRIKKAEYKVFYNNIKELLKKSDTCLINFKKQKVDEKGDALEKVMQENPDDVGALLNLSKHYLIKGKYEDAKELLEKAIKLDPNNGEIHYFLGITFGYLDQDDQSQELIIKARELGYRH